MKIEITIRRPDDMHVHLRDSQMLYQVAPETARRYGRAIIMPTLVPPVTEIDMVTKYHEQVVAATNGFFFEPLMTMYLTDNTTVEDVQDAEASPITYAFKLYPAGATTNSDAGVTNLRYLWDAIDEMQRANIPLLIHGEVTEPDVDIFDREAMFIDRHLTTIVHNFPNLKIVLEHITTSEGVQYVLETPNVYGTITPHHLMLNRNEVLTAYENPTKSK